LLYGQQISDRAAGAEAEPEDEGIEDLQALVPQVVAVVVACDPGQWFEEELEALRSQAYPELSVLVLDVGSRDGLADRVASVLPGAFVRKMPSNEGFGATANAVLDMVEGASHLLLCHDDVAPDEDVVSILVEESFRSNAGIVAPKYVSWEDPRRLLQVGMAVDKGGAVVDRVEAGEIDHGQHDSVRDVFLADGGCLLVRADLFAEIGGFDSRIFAMGEDLDLCWRAQVAGARVIVAPGARVRHLELLASGHRALPASVRHAVPSAIEPLSPGAGARTEQAPDSVGAESARRRRAVRGLLSSRRRTAQVTLQALQRRHEMRAVLKNYSGFHRLRVLPQTVLLQMAEVLVALVTGHGERAAAVVHAWRWNLTERSSLRSARAQVRAWRRLDDASVRRLQLHGSARLNAYLRRVVTHGMRAARLGSLEDLAQGADEDESLAEEDERRRTASATRFARTVVWGLVALVLLFGSRDILGGGFPFVGQLLRFPQWSDLLHRYFAGWQPSGVGTVSSSSPATGILGLGGLALFGATGLLQKVVVLGCLPVGAIGMSRVAGSFGSVRARLAATIVYLAAPLAYDALASARWDALVVYGAGPWIFGRLGRASGVAPLWCARSDARLARWRTSLPGRAVGLGLLVAVTVALAPTSAAVTLTIAVAMALGLVLVGGRGAFRAAGRVVVVAVGACLVGLVLLLPWSFSVFEGSLRWQTLAGLASSAASGPSWGALLHLGVGPIGDSVLAWGFVAAAGLPILVATESRLRWAAVCWTTTLGSAGLAWAAGRNWLGAFHVTSEILLVPALVGVSLAAGIGTAAFEADLSRHRFGWRHAVAALAAACAAVATVPVLSATTSGRWDMPQSGYAEATSWMSSQAPGAFRVLWIGDPAVLPGGAWQLSDGLAYELSEDGLPDATSLWPASDTGPARAVAKAVELLERGDTVRFGQLVSPFAVRYVVVVTSLGPFIPGSSMPLQRSAPPRLLSFLNSQIDLREVIGQGGYAVFSNDGALPLRAESDLAASTPSSLTAPTGVSSARSPAWKAVLRGPAGATSITGRVGAGRLFDAVAPARAWELIGPGGVVEVSRGAGSYGASFVVRRPGIVTVRYTGSWRHGLAIAGQVALWVVLSIALSLRPSWRRRLFERRRRSRVRVRQAPAHGDELVVEDRSATPALSETAR
jgi:GT2 family glycosyltransferase